MVVALCGCSNGGYPCLGRRFAQCVVEPNDCRRVERSRAGRSSRGDGSPVQMIAKGALASIDDARRIIGESFPTERFQPQGSGGFDAASEFFELLL